MFGYTLFFKLKYTQTQCVVSVNIITALVGVEVERKYLKNSLPGHLNHDLLVESPAQ